MKKAKVYYCPQCGEKMRGLWIKFHNKNLKNFVRIPYVYCIKCDLIKSVEPEDEAIIVEKMLRHIEKLK